MVVDIHKGKEKNRVSPAALSRSGLSWDREEGLIPPGQPPAARSRSVATGPFIAGTTDTQGSSRCLFWAPTSEWHLSLIRMYLIVSFSSPQAAQLDGFTMLCPSCSLLPPKGRTLECDFGCLVGLSAGTLTMPSFQHRCNKLLIPRLCAARRCILSLSFLLVIADLGDYLSPCCVYSIKAIDT